MPPSKCGDIVGGVGWNSGIPRRSARNRNQIFIEVSQRALKTLFEIYPTKTRDEVEAALLTDLNVACAVTSAFDHDKSHSESISIYGASFLCTAFVALPDEDRLFITSLSQVSPTHAERRRDLAMPLNVLFRPGKPGLASPGRESILALREELAKFRLEQAARITKNKEEELFRLWASILKAKTAIEKSKENPIPYQSFSINENRITFSVKGLSGADLTGQARLVRDDAFVKVTGEVEKATNSEITLYVNNWYSHDIPDNGILSIDVEASRLAIERQRAALDAVRFNRGVRADLGKLCIHPEYSKVPTADNTFSAVQPDLDDPKIKAVSAALGTQDLLLVQGPPGTGKTTFITELILQCLKKFPHWRVLLTSQTHVALDNALENLIPLQATHRMVRIGRSENSRISKAVESLLLDTQMDTWREEVLGKGRKFLEDLASRQGISHKQVQIGIEFERLSMLEGDLNELKARDTSIESRIQELTPKVTPVRAGKTIKQPSLEEIEQQRELQEERAKVRGEIRSRIAQCDAIRANLRSLDPDTSQLFALPSHELHSWSRTYLPKNDVNQKLRQMFETHAEWQARFGRTSDFQAALLRAAQVVAGTCIGIAAVKGLPELDFDICIVDEASKATPTELLVPLSRCRRWVVVGDQKQLPPFVDEGFRDPEMLERFGLDERSIKATLFDRLQELLPAGCKTMLSTQYRMVPPIGNLISECFYSGSLRSAPKEWDRTFEKALSKPVVWLSTSRDLKRHETSAGRSYYNETEARVIHSLLKRLNGLASGEKASLENSCIDGLRPPNSTAGKAICKGHAELPKSHDRVEHNRCRSRASGRCDNLFGYTIKP